MQDADFMSSAQSRDRCEVEACYLLVVVIDGWLDRQDGQEVSRC